MVVLGVAAIVGGMASGFVAARHVFNGDYSSPTKTSIRQPLTAHTSYHWTEGLVVALVVAAIVFGVLFFVDRASRRARGLARRRQRVITSRPTLAGREVPFSRGGWF
jgi:hypothetical protein